MRYLPDTNILSNATKPVAARSLVTWMTEQANEDLFIASFTLAEIRRRILEKPPGRKRHDLDLWFSGPTGPPAIFVGRVLPFDEKAALVWARLMADGKAMGRPRSGLDTIIASIAQANGPVIVTDNEKDFWRIELFNPLRADD